MIVREVRGPYPEPLVIPLAPTSCTRAMNQEGQFRCAGSAGEMQPQSAEPPGGTRIEPVTPADPAATFLHQLRSYDRCYQDLGISVSDIDEFYKAVFQLYSRVNSAKELEGVIGRLTDLSRKPLLWEGGAALTQLSPLPQQNTPVAGVNQLTPGPIINQLEDRSVNKRKACVRE
uniref:Uncharacterized protein n=1 Tax=Rhodosorus marinus TaxID=101924 RepID=A0A7S2ZBN0_9RHOD|mmetsp:Transcript_11246/g.46967  ORF Transcript_11246/g.46967 Transcript_11246/m.46967 type:complete len:174 (+) Transcript_11246:46-567(+)